ncbi:hypothetical protein NNG48_07030 [Enterococcus faecium]|nr:hypothetical protein [Enterococcus faecium]
MKTQEQLQFIWDCYQHLSEAFKQQVNFVDYAIGNYDEEFWFGGVE